MLETCSQTAASCQAVVLCRYLCTSSGDGLIKTWTLASGGDSTSMLECSATLQGHSAAVLCLAASQQEAHLYSGSADHTVKFWDLSIESRHCRSTLALHSSAVVSLALAGTLLVSVGEDQLSCVWDLSSMSCIQRISVNLTDNVLAPVLTVHAITEGRLD
jgi:WD40 repeat protein